MVYTIDMCFGRGLLVGTQWAKDAGVDTACAERRRGCQPMELFRTRVGSGVPSAGRK